MAGKAPDIRRRRPTRNPARILVKRFAVLVALGAIFLALPWASSKGESVGFLDAFFTSTSAVCGGLTVLDTAKDFTLFGKIVILLLIQLGGLGIMLWSSALVGLFGVELDLDERLLLSEGEPGFSIGGGENMARQVVIFTLVSEAVGALLLYLLVEDNAFSAVFHSISAFCNAGFALRSDNLALYLHAKCASFVIIALMMLGSTGFLALRDLWASRKGRRMSLQAKLILVTTLVLTLAGALSFWIFEAHNPNTIGGLSTGEQFWASLFASVTPRTTGFAEVDYGKVTEGTLLMTITLMAVGGAPGSTAGGIKLTTAALLLMATWSQIKGYDQVTVGSRQVPTRRVLQALALTVSFALAVLGLSLMLHYLENFSFSQVLFESASALGTCGLSTGITPGLSPLSKVLVALAMFGGRVGPLTAVLSLMRKQQVLPITRPVEEVAIG